jgi:hypothetical protein
MCQGKFCKASRRDRADSRGCGDALATSLPVTHTHLGYAPGWDSLRNNTSRLMVNMDKIPPMMSAGRGTSAGTKGVGKSASLRLRSEEGAEMREAIVATVDPTGKW